MADNRTPRTTDGKGEQEQKSLLGSSYSYVDKADVSKQSVDDFANEGLED
jgi:hypothetical protein